MDVSFTWDSFKSQAADFSFESRPTETGQLFHADPNAFADKQAARQACQELGSEVCYGIGLFEQQLGQQQLGAEAVARTEPAAVRPPAVSTLFGNTNGGVAASGSGYVVLFAKKQAQESAPPLPFPACCRFYPAAMYAPGGQATTPDRDDAVAECGSPEDNLKCGAVNDGPGEVRLQRIEQMVDLTKPDPSGQVRSSMGGGFQAPTFSVQVRVALPTSYLRQHLNYSLHLITVPCCSCVWPGTSSRLAPILAFTWR